MNERSNRKVSAIITALVILSTGLVLGWPTWRGKAANAPSTDAQTPRTPALHSRALLEAWRDSGASPSVISGRVAQTGGAGRPGAVVCLVAAASYEESQDDRCFEPAAMQVSSDDGGFRFSGVPPGSYSLTATAKGWAPAERTGITVVDGETFAGLELRLSPAAVSLSGTVSDAAGLPIPGAAVRALILGPGGRPDPTRAYVSLTDAHGVFDLGLLPRGYRIAVHGDGHARAVTTLWLGRPRQQHFRLPPAARIMGTVFRHEVPVAGAAVRLELVDRSVVPGPTISTAPSGTFSFQNVQPGSYTISAMAGNLAGRTLKTVTVAAGARAKVAIQLLPRLAVFGTVVDHSGNPVVDARVRGPQIRASASVDVSGRFTLEGFPPGAHELVTRASGFGTICTKLVVGDEAPEVRISLMSEARVRGRVLDRSGRPVAGASVMVTENPATHLVCNLAIGRSDSRGRFDLGGLSAGVQLKVEAEHPDLGRGLARPFALSAGAARELDVRLGRGGFVRGTVRWDDHTPAAGAAVWGLVKGRLALVTQASAEGRYEIGPFLASQIDLNALPSIDAIGGRPDGDKTIAFGGREDVDGVDLVISRRDREISGVVLGPDGRPLADATVGVALERDGESFRPFDRVAIDHSRGNYTAISDSRGAFAVRHLPMGKYTLWSTHPRFPEADVYGAPSGKVGVRVQFSKGARISGTVVSSDGRRVSGYSIYALLAGAGNAFSGVRKALGYVQGEMTVSDPAGSFEFGNLQPAIYGLIAVTPSHGGRLDGIALEPGEGKTVQIVLKESITLKGKMVDPQTSRPLPDLWIRIGLAHLREQRVVRSGADGSFALPRIVPGSMVLEVDDPRTRQSFRRPIKVPARAREYDLGTLPFEAEASTCGSCGVAGANTTR
jgi:hypothetical protein